MEAAKALIQRAAAALAACAPEKSWVDGRRMPAGGRRSRLDMRRRASDPVRSPLPLSALKVDLAQTWWFGLGYWLGAHDGDYPEVGVVFEVFPSSPRRGEMLAEFRSIARRQGWRRAHLDVDGAWSTVRRVRPLHAFLAGEDHLAALRAFFLELLAEIAEIRDAHRQLPWLATADELEG